MLHQEVVLGLSLADWLALCWFVLCWAGYTRYAERKALRRDCLASVLHRQRRRWMHEMLGRENRVADASLMANLERNVAFFASSTLIILAGVFTVLSATDKAISIAAELPFAVGASAERLQAAPGKRATVHEFGYRVFVHQHSRALPFGQSLPHVASSPTSGRDRADPKRDRHCQPAAVRLASVAAISN